MLCQLHIFIATYFLNRSPRIKITIVYNKVFLITNTVKCKLLRCSRFPTKLQNSFDSLTSSFFSSLCRFFLSFFSSSNNRSTSDRHRHRKTTFRFTPKNRLLQREASQQTATLGFVRPATSAEEKRLKWCWFSRI